MQSYLCKLFYVLNQCIDGFTNASLTFTEEYLSYMFKVASTTSDVVIKNITFP
jgi:hypothetical protein